MHQEHPFRDFNEYTNYLADNMPRLAHGSHQPGSPFLCAMEMVAFLDRQQHTDQPRRVCRFLCRQVIGLNDNMNQEDRQKLMPILHRLIDTEWEGSVTFHETHFRRFMNDNFHGGYANHELALDALKHTLDVSEDFRGRKNPWYTTQKIETVKVYQQQQLRRYAAGNRYKPLQSSAFDVSGQPVHNDL